MALQELKSSGHGLKHMTCKVLAKLYAVVLVWFLLCSSLFPASVHHICQHSERGLPNFFPTHPSGRCPVPPPLWLPLPMGGGTSSDWAWLGSRTGHTFFPCWSRWPIPFLCLPYPSGGNNSSSEHKKNLKSLFCSSTPSFYVLELCSKCCFNTML